MLDRFRPLRDFAELISGQHVTASDVLDDLSEMPYLTGPSDFDGVRPRTQRSTSAATAFAEPGDLLITVKGSGVGSYAFADRRYAISRQLMAIRAKVPNCPEFVFQSVIWRASTLASISRGTIPGLSREDILSVSVANCSLVEQRKIAEVLRTWDVAIEKLEALRATKSPSLKALTRLLVFGGRKLAAYDVKAAKVSHRWFALPANWACVLISDVAREIAERHTGGGDYEVLSCSKYDGFVRSLEYFKKQVFSTDLDGYKKIWRSDFGFPSNHVEEGSIGLQNLVEVGLVSPIYTVFRFDPSKVLPEYAFAVLKTDLYRHIFEVSTSASVDRRGSLRWSEFSKIPFPLPSLAEQKAIVEVLHTAKAEIDILDKEIEAVTRQKRGLMQKLLTGEWRVKVDGNEGSAA
jgi:type I restriction enzyme S subunit